MSNKLSPYKARLLVPGASGQPAHMAISHDARVYEELANPAITAAIYVPRWSEGVCAAFAQIARLSPHTTNRAIFDTKNLNLAAQPDAAQQAECKALADERTSFWLQGTLSHPPTSHVVDEIAEQQIHFINAANRLLQRPQPQGLLHVSGGLSLLAQHNNWNWSHNPARLKQSWAHTDSSDNGIFAFPVGTVLVDQDNLDMAKVRESQGTHEDFIRLSRLANRLWQLPEGSFALWRASQYHFHPLPLRDRIRYRLFATP